MLTDESKIKSRMSKTPIVVLCAFICSALWGSAFAGVKVGYRLFGINASDSFSQMVFAGVRFALAGAMAIAIGSFGRKKFLAPTRRALPKICVISLFQTVLQYFFYYIGLAHTTGVKAAVIVGANVFVSILIASVIFHSEKLTAVKVIGSVVGFSGIVLINAGGLTGGFSFLGDGFIFLCDIAMGFSSAFMNKYSKSEDPVMLSGWQFLLGGGVMAIFGFAGGGSLGRITPASMGILLYLAFVSAAAYSLWSVLLKYNPVSRVTVFGFMNPICGVVISSAVLGERGIFTLTGLISLFLVCLGIFIVNHYK